MTDGFQDRGGDVLFEAFRAGWQAALAITITNPRVLAVVESCFEMWLAETAEERADAEPFALALAVKQDAPSPTGEPVIGTTSTGRHRRPRFSRPVS